MRFRNPTRVAVVLTTGMLVMIACALGAQQLRGQNQSDEGQTASIVTDMITKRHISHAPIDDEVSKKLLERYLKALDPQKLYFSKNEVDALRQQNTKLDDQIKVGDVSFAFAVFERYQLRMKERLATVGKLIDTKHDFTIDEEMLIDADDRDWATSSAEMNERWRKRIKYEILSLKLDDKELAEARAKVRKRYETLQKLMSQTESSEVLEIYLSSLTHTLDPHSSYMSPDLSLIHISEPTRPY